MNNFEASLFDELEALYPDSNVKEGKTHYEVSATNGTYAGVNIMLTGLQAGMPVTFSIKGPHKKYKLLEMVAVPVEINSGYEVRAESIDNKYNPNVIRRAPFLVYDALKPFSNIISAKGVSVAITFRCKVEVEEYTYQPWDIEITHCGVTRKLLFVVEAFTTYVPKAGKDTHKYVNWFSSETFEINHNSLKFSDRWFKIFEGYLKLANYGRQNMLCISPDWIFDYKGEDPILNEERLDRIIKIADRCGMYWLSGGDLISRKNGEWEATTAQTCFGDLPIPGIGEQQLEAMAKSIYQYLEKNDLKDRWMQSLMDEPLNCNADTWKLGSKMLHSAMPGIPLLEASIARESIAGAIDIWCPTVDKYERYSEFFAERREQGDRFFVYTCLQPAGQYCNRLLDMERIRAVWLGWAPARYPSIEGFLHWGGNWFGSENGDGVWGQFEPYYLYSGQGHISDYDIDKYNILPAGDSAIMYPGYCAPLSSVRLEAQRIGLEDLCLLEELKKRSSTRADEIISSVFRGYSDYEKSVNKYRDAKRKLLKELEPEKTAPMNE